MPLVLLGIGMFSLLLPWEADMHLPCSHPLWPHVPGEAGCGLSGAGVFSKLPENGLFHSKTCDRSLGGCLCSSGRDLSPSQDFFWELTVPTLSPER